MSWLKKNADAVANQNVYIGGFVSEQSKRIEKLAREYAERAVRSVKINDCGPVDGMTLGDEDIDLALEEADKDNT